MFRLTSMVSMLLAASIVLGACGGGESGSDPGPVSSPADATGLRSGSSVEGSAIADFTLAMGDGTTFVMSEALAPVYLIFWAEW